MPTRANLTVRVDLFGSTCGMKPNTFGPIPESRRKNMGAEIQGNHRSTFLSPCWPNGKERRHKSPASSWRLGRCIDRSDRNHSRLL